MDFPRLTVAKYESRKITPKFMGCFCRSTKNTSNHHISGGKDSSYLNMVMKDKLSITQSPCQDPPLFKHRSDHRKVTLNESLSSSSGNGLKGVVVFDFDSVFPENSGRFMSDSWSSESSSEELYEVDKEYKNQLAYQDIIRMNQYKTSALDISNALDRIGYDSNTYLKKMTLGSLDPLHLDERFENSKQIRRHRTHKEKRMRSKLQNLKTGKIEN